jgi:hypothetical protein
VEQFKYLGTTPMNQNPFRKKLREDWSWECLLSFNAGSSVFQFAIQKYKD